MIELHGAVMSQLLGLDTHSWHGGKPDAGSCGRVKAVASKVKSTVVDLKSMLAAVRSVKQIDRYKVWCSELIS